MEKENPDDHKITKSDVRWHMTTMGMNMTFATLFFTMILLKLARSNGPTFFRPTAEKLEDWVDGANQLVGLLWAILVLKPQYQKLKSMRRSLARDQARNQPRSEAPLLTAVTVIRDNREHDAFEKLAEQASVLSSPVPSPLRQVAVEITHRTGLQETLDEPLLASAPS